MTANNCLHSFTLHNAPLVGVKQIATTTDEEASSGLEESPSLELLTPGKNCFFIAKSFYIKINYFKSQSKRLWHMLPPGRPSKTLPKPVLLSCLYNQTFNTKRVQK